MEFSLFLIPAVKLIREVFDVFRPIITLKLLCMTYEPRNVKFVVESF